MAATSGSGSQFRGRYGIYLAIIAAVTIISLVALSKIGINTGCTEIDILGMKYKQCGDLPYISAFKQVAKDTIPVGTSLPGNPSEVSEVVETASSSNVTDKPLESIVGDWLASGNTSDQKPFSASFSYRDNNQYTATLNIDNALTNSINGKYNFSLSQEQLTLQPYGSDAVNYKIVQTTSNSFTVSDQSGSKITFARTET